MQGSPLSRRLAGIVIVLVVVAGAFALRCARISEVREGGAVQIFHDDPPYHLRRALMTLAAWPRVPAFDSMLGFPDGAEVTWPPGMAWLLAGASRALGARGPADRAIVESAAIWIPPLLGALTVLALYLGSRFHLGHGGAALAAVALAIHPAHVEYTLIGRYDHHPFEALVTWLLLIGVVRASDPGPGRCWPWVGLGAGAVGLGFLVLPGALLHLALIATALLLTTALLPAEASIRLGRVCAMTFAWGLLASAPALVCSPWSQRPVFFAVSPLQLACVAAAALLFAAIGWRVPQRVPAPVRAALAFVLVAAIALAVPALRGALADGLRYTLASPFAPLATESRGLLADSSDLVRMAGWILGTALCLGLFRRLRRDGGAAATAVAAAALLLLLAGFVAVRWLVAWAPFAAVAVPLAWRHGVRPLGERWIHGHPLRWTSLWCALALLLSVAPVLHSLSLEVATPVKRRAAAFLRELRSLTPAATANELSARARPSYGILATWSIGHWITYLSGRPTLANNFFGAPFQDRANARAFRLLLSPDCDGAAAEMDALRLRYLLVTPPEPRELPVMAQIAGYDPGAFLGPGGEPLSRARRSLWLRLGPADGQSVALDGERLPACGRFRLVAELPSGGASPGPFKLFEQVAGAALEVRALAGEPVALTLALRTRHGRGITWFSQLVAGSTGLVRLRLPYPTDGSCWARTSPCPVTTASAYRLAIGRGPARLLAVSEEAVATGRTLRR